MLRIVASPLVFACFWVLLIPFFGRFICPFAVAGLGFKYYVTNLSDIFGHPIRYPYRKAFIKLEISESDFIKSGEKLDYLKSKINPDYI